MLDLGVKYGCCVAPWPACMDWSDTDCTVLVLAIELPLLPSPIIDMVAPPVSMGI